MQTDRAIDVPVIPDHPAFRFPGRAIDGVLPVLAEPYGNDFGSAGPRSGYGQPNANNRSYGGAGGGGFPPHVLVNTTSANNQLSFMTDGGMYWWDFIAPFPGVLVGAWHPGGIGPLGTYFGNIFAGLSDYGVAQRTNYTLPWPPTSTGTWATALPWANNQHRALGNAPAGLTTSANWIGTILFAGQRRGSFFSIATRNGVGATDFNVPFIAGGADYPSAIWFEIQYP